MKKSQSHNTNLNKISINPNNNKTILDHNPNNKTTSILPQETTTITIQLLKWTFSEGILQVIWT